jgi:DNA-binding CsgD family transcriptional regulator
MITAQETALLISIAQAGADGGNWPPMLRALAEHLQADQAQFLTPSQAWDQNGPISHGMLDHLSGLRLGRVYTGEELTDRAPTLGDDASDQRAIGLRNPQGAAWLLVKRRRSEFRAIDSAMLDALAPHLEHAIKTAAQIASLSQRIGQAEGVARRLGVGRVTFDARGQPQPCDPVAADSLAQLATAPTMPRDLSRVALLRLGPDLDLLCQRGPDGTVSGILRSGGQPLPAPEYLAEALSLTLSEARLVRALAQGESLKDAAQSLGLTLETARYYSKQIFAKTGLSGQTDLMRRIWTSALVLG